MNRIQPQRNAKNIARQKFIDLIDTDSEPEESSHRKRKINDYDEEYGKPSKKNKNKNKRRVKIIKNNITEETIHMEIISDEKQIRSDDEKQIRSDEINIKINFQPTDMEI
jgi:hypothetical protein